MFNPIKIIKYQLYLLQLESYELGRFWKLLFQKGLLPPKDPLRKQLVWTKKTILLLVTSQILIFVFAGFIAYQLYQIAIENTAAATIIFIGLAFIFELLSFIFLIAATLVLWPIDFVVKQIIVSMAKNKIRHLSNLKIVGIAGSYGKTTMKEVLFSVLSEKFKVAATPESVNTPVGISRWILNSVNESTQIIVVEMGEHYRGDISELCEITPPDVAVITGINESHLERMGNLENIKATIVEIVRGAKQNALVVLNADDQNVLDVYKSSVLTGSREFLKFYSYKNSGLCEYKITDRQFLPDGRGWQFAVENFGQLKTAILGEYVLGNSIAAIIAGKFFGMQAEQIQTGIAKIKPIEHRLQPIFSPENVLVIDDSYNGNPEGVKEAINTLAQFSGRRKIYITPGLVEMGAASSGIHHTIGQGLAKVADIVILIRNSVTPWIEEGIKSVDVGTQNQIIWFNTAPEAHAALKDILKPGDVILFQNDWGDQYV